MPRKLKTYLTSLGFFELAVAAPSMKAALEAWGMARNAFHQGFATETNDPRIVAMTMAQPGVVLKRPVGTQGAFKENAELPKELWTPSRAKPAPAPQPARTHAKTKAKPKTRPQVANANEKDRAAILSFKKATERREREREQQKSREDARQAKERSQTERAIRKAEQDLSRARERHEDAISAIDKEREKLDRRADAENNRWDSEQQKLRAALQRARR